MQSVLFDVPQWSLLGPLLYVSYTAELTKIVAHHRLHLHMYADDCQIYFSASVEDAPHMAVTKFIARVADINAWLRTWLWPGGVAVSASNTRLKR